MHIFMTCPHTTQIWQHVQLNHEVSSTALNYLSFIGAFFNLLSVLSTSQVHTLAMMFWIIWKRRNEKLWEGIIRPYAVLVQAALDYLQQWELVRTSRVTAATTSSNATSVPSPLSWQKLCVGSLKCNVDATIFSEENKYGVGIYLCDNYDTFRGTKTSRSSWSNSSATIFQGEAFYIICY